MAAAGGQASDNVPHRFEHTEKETPINHVIAIFPYLFRRMAQGAGVHYGAPQAPRTGPRGRSRASAGRGEACPPRGDAIQKT